MTEILADVAKMKVLALLIETARRCGVTTYREIASVTGWLGQGSNFASRVGRLLFDINLGEHEQGRPMLSVVVVNRKPRHREESSVRGFFACAQQLGLLSPRASVASREEFLAEQLRQVYETWAN